MERAHKYEFEGKVRYSEIDHRATMTLPALINYFQDCSTFQSEDLGIGTTVLQYLSVRATRIWNGCVEKREKSVGFGILAGDCEKVSEAMRKDHSRNICFRF